MKSRNKKDVLGRGHWVRMAFNLCSSWRQDEDSEWFHFIYILYLDFTTQYIHCVCRVRILYLSHFIPLIKIYNGQIIEIWENLISGGQLNVSVAVIYFLLNIPPPLIRSRISWSVTPSSRSFARSMTSWMTSGRTVGLNSSTRSGIKSERIWLTRSPRSPPPRIPSKSTWK